MTMEAVIKRAQDRLRMPEQPWWRRRRTRWDSGVVAVLWGFGTGTFLWGLIAATFYFLR